MKPENQNAREPENQKKPKKPEKPEEPEKTTTEKHRNPETQEPNDIGA